MSKLENESLIAALEEAKCKDLPPELKDGEIFVRALVRVLKSNNREAYCYAINDGTNNPVIKKSFGSVAQIVRIISIHPLSVLNRNYIPKFNEKNEVRMHLCRAGESNDYLSRLFNENTEENKAKIKALVIKYSIQDQLKDELQADYAQRRAAREAEAAKRAVEAEKAKEAERERKEQELKKRIKEKNNDNSKAKSKRGRKKAVSTEETERESSAAESDM